MTGVYGFLSGGMGAGELLVIFIVILVLFGPRRLPSIARMIGQALAELRRASHDFRTQVMALDAEPSAVPPAAPLSSDTPVVGGGEVGGVARSGGEAVSGPAVERGETDAS